MNSIYVRILPYGGYSLCEYINDEEGYLFTDTKELPQEIAVKVAILNVAGLGNRIKGIGMLRNTGYDIDVEDL
jgi:hypothetical protein